MKRRKWRGNRIRNGVWEPGYKNPDIQVCIRYSESEVAQSCPTLCDHMDRGAHQASFQARILEKVAISCSRNFPFYISPFTEETERQVSLVYFIWFCQKTIILTINLTLVLYLTWNFLFFFLVKNNGNLFLTVLEAGLEDSVSGSAHFLFHIWLSLTRPSHARALRQFSGSVS